MKRIVELWRHQQELKAQAKEKKRRKEVMRAALERSRHRQQQQPTYTRSSLHPLYEKDEDEEDGGTAKASTAQAQADFPLHAPRKGVLPPFLLWQEEQRRRMARLEQEGAERGGAEGEEKEEEEEEEEEEGEEEDWGEVKDEKEIDLEAAELEMEILPLDTASYSGSEGGRVEDDEEEEEEEEEAQRETERRRQAKEARLPFFTRVCVSGSVTFLIAYGVGLGGAVVIAKYVEMHVVRAV
jgi:hypothetical protein